MYDLFFLDMISLAATLGYAHGALLSHMYHVISITLGVSLLPLLVSSYDWICWSAKIFYGFSCG